MTDRVEEDYKEYSEITIEEFCGAIAKYWNSNKINPRDIGCLYTAINDPSYHCIIGQVLFDLNCLVPGPSVILPAADILINASDNVRVLASKLQNKADILNTAWKEAIAYTLLDTKNFTFHSILVKAIEDEKAKS